MLTKEEIRKLSDKDLDAEIAEANAKLVKLSVSLNSRETKSVAQLKILRKYIARIKTIKRELDIPEAKEATNTAATK